jgi:hypothetical protein
MLKTLSYAAVLLSMAAAAAPAQTVELGVMGGYPRWGRAPLGSVSAELVEDTDTQLKGDYVYGASLTVNTKGYYGFEGGYMRDVNRITTVTRQTAGTTVFTTSHEDRRTVHMAYLNALVYFMPKGERWRPFVTGGLQGYNFTRPQIPVFAGINSIRHYGGNFGGGVKLKLFSHALVRWDLRDYIGGKPWNLTFANSTHSAGHIHLIEGTMGVALTF